MINTFADKLTAAVFAGKRVKSLPVIIQSRARAKLVQLDAAENLDDLRIPPGNRLEALSRDRKGRHSIRINDQWRVCFQWSRGNAYRVEICDYH